MTRKLFLLCGLMAGLGLFPAGHLMAQTFTPLHSFAGSPGDGAYPQAGLILSGNTLYGTANKGGSSGNGTLYSLRTNGAGFTNFYNFTGGSDGAAPVSGLILSGNTLYGTASHGGNPDSGTVFAVSTNGAGFTNLYSFSAMVSLTNSDGAFPDDLILSGDTLYGTAGSGGSLGSGAVFSLGTNGASFTNLYSFSASIVNSNGDGAFPEGVILSGNTLYGTTVQAGPSQGGTVFAINTSGLDFTNLHNFSLSGGNSPEASMTLSGGTLYGTTFSGGRFGIGTIFTINTNGMGYTNIYNFTAVGNGGYAPAAGLVLAGDTLYGTTALGGGSGFGTVFAINTNGTDYRTLYAFTAPSANSSGVSTNSDGAYPISGLILSGNTLYGTTSAGGASGNGTVFSLSLSPQLAISLSGTNVILTWPAGATGYTLQSTTNLGPAAVWTTVDGQNAVTNPISGTQMFYRLTQ